MGPIFYVMAILGCGDGQSGCEQVRLTGVHYATAEACTAASEQALLNATDLAYPEVMTECRAAPRNLVAQTEGRPRG